MKACCQFGCHCYLVFCTLLTFARSSLPAFCTPLPLQLYLCPKILTNYNQLIHAWDLPLHPPSPSFIFRLTSATDFAEEPMWPVCHFHMLRSFADTSVMHIHTTVCIRMAIVILIAILLVKYIFIFNWAYNLACDFSN